MDPNIPRTTPRKSATFDDYTLSEIRRAASTGIYDIRGAGAKRKLPHFDDLLFLGASISRYPLEGYREKCGTDVVLGTRFAKKPIELKIPITIAGMSFGSLSAQAKEALGRGATIAGTSTTTGDGGMTPEERGHSKTLVYQYLPSRYGMNPDDLRKADAIEVVVGQGAKPGGGGMLLGQKISDRVAQMRCLPKGIDQRSACRHPDWTGPDDLEIKIHELREITDWEKPIYVKVGGARPYYDTALAVKSGADVVVVDGMQGGTAATQEVFIEHVGQPTLACIRPAVQALQELGMHRKVQLIVSGGIRNGADVAKALALGADAVSIGTAALVALGDNDPHLEDEYQKLGTTAGAYDDWHEGRDPAGITTQDPELAETARSGARRPAACQLSQSHDARGADHRAGLRQDPCAQSRAGRPRGPDRRGGGDGAGALGRDQLDPGQERRLARMGVYKAKVNWRRGAQKFTDMKFSRAHEWSFDGGITVRGSSSPHVVPQPYSDETAIDPEEAFVASLSSCHMLTFLYFAAKKGFVVDDYVDDAQGTLAKNAQGKLAMTEVVLRPRISFSGDKQPTARELDALHHKAHEECFIANSVTTNVRVEPVS